MLVLFSLVFSPKTYATQNPIASFSFDSASSPLLDDSGNNNSGTCGTSCPTYVPGGGHTGGGYDFSGSTGYIVLPNENLFDFTTTFTVSFWMKTSATQNDWDALIAKGDSAWGVSLFGNTPVANFSTWHAGNPNDISGGPNLNNDSWHYVAVTYDGSVKRVYIDGTQVVTTSIAQAIQQNNLAARLGLNEQYTAADYSGWLDDVRIYSRALSQTEITTDMNTPIN